MQFWIGIMTLPVQTVVGRATGNIINHSIAQEIRDFNQYSMILLQLICVSCKSQVLVAFSSAFQLAKPVRSIVCLAGI